MGDLFYAHLLRNDLSSLRTGPFIAPDEAVTAAKKLLGDPSAVSVSAVCSTYDRVRRGRIWRTDRAFAGESAHSLVPTLFPETGRYIVDQSLVEESDGARSFGFFGSFRDHESHVLRADARAAEHRTGRGAIRVIRVWKNPKAGVVGDLVAPDAESELLIGIRRTPSPSEVIAEIGRATTPSIEPMPVERKVTEPRALRPDVDLLCMSIRAGLIDPLDDDQESAEDRLGGLQEAAYVRDLAKCVLSPLEQEVLAHRFGLDGADELTLRDLGKRIGGRSPERTRQLQELALAKIRRVFGRNLREVTEAIQNKTRADELERQRRDREAAEARDENLRQRIAKLVAERARIEAKLEELAGATG